MYIHTLYIFITYITQRIFVFYANNKEGASYYACCGVYSSGLFTKDESISGMNNVFHIR